MCIRDSFGFAEQQLSQGIAHKDAVLRRDQQLAMVAEGAGPDADRRQPAARGHGAAAGPAPVSYTHLRAHETVLDLVCRLLLEKKKRKHHI